MINTAFTVLSAIIRAEMRECFHFERNIFGLRYYEFHFIGVLTFFLLYAFFYKVYAKIQLCTQIVSKPVVAHIKKA